jgi:hypothetical protein
MEKISIHAFRAVDSKEMTIRYIHEHTRVLQDIGVSTAMKLDFGWCLDPQSTIIAAFHETLGMVGGVRIQMGRADHPMAMEKAIGQMDPEFHGTVAPLIESGTAELCGLWVAHRFLGRGLPKLLVPAGVAVASQLNITSLLTFAAEYTLQLTVDSGFIRMKDVGFNGEFIYPIASIRSYAMSINDVSLLSNCTLEKRIGILGLRAKTNQVVLVRPKNTELQVHYILDRNIPMVDIHNVAGQPDLIKLRRTA